MEGARRGEGRREGWGGSERYREALHANERSGAVGQEDCVLPAQLPRQALVPSLVCIRAKKEHLKAFEGRVPQRQGQNLAEEDLHSRLIDFCTAQL